MANTNYQYEPLPVPSSWGREERQFAQRLSDILDDIFMRYGRLGEKELGTALRAKINSKVDGSTLGGYSTIEQTDQKISTAVSSKADASALENYSTIEQTASAITTAVSSKANTSDLEDYVSTINGAIGGLQSQIDGKVETWYYSGAPTTANTPASSWTTTDLKNKHLGDLYYDTATGFVYRYKVSDGAYSWERIKDSDITAAMAQASTAQDTADGKRRVFVTTPTPPYDVGDLWAQGASGDLMRCKTAKATGASYSSADWELATKYTDDSYASDFVNSIYSADKENLQAQIDGKVETWYYSGVPTTANTPASSWTTTDVKNKHLGDLYYDTATGFVYRYKVSDGAYSWERIKDSDITAAMAQASTAQDTADGKRRVFVTTPTPPYDVGDLWAQGASGDLMRCKTAKATGASYSSADWEKASKYTDDSALVNYSTITQTSEAITAAVGNVRVGGRNLLLGTTEEISLSANGLVGSYDLAVPYGEIMGAQMILAFDWTLVGDTSASVSAYRGDSGGGLIGTAALSGTSGRATLLITMPTPLTAFDRVSFYISGLSGTVRISKTQLERGNKATDWGQADSELVAKRYPSPATRFGSTRPPSRSARAGISTCHWTVRAATSRS